MDGGKNNQSGFFDFDAIGRSSEHDEQENACKVASLHGVRNMAPNH